MNNIYLHRGQLLWQLIQPLHSIMICSRRWGKSYIIAMSIMRNVLTMPRSTGVFLASSFRQAHSRTLPSALMALEVFGWKRDVHYVIGHKPDKRLGFETPYFLPNDLKDVVWFANGTIMIIVSQEVPMSSNSLTIHWLEADEAKGLDHKKIDEEIMPAMGGASIHYADPIKYPYLWGWTFTTDMPVCKEGLWLIKNYEDKYDPELCNMILGLEMKRQSLLAVQQNSYTKKELSYINRSLAQLRRSVVYFQERSIFDNIDIVTPEYVARMERDLTPSVFRAEILSQRVTETEDKFYLCFSPSIHTYTANDNTKLNNYKRQEYDCTFDTDVESNEPIAISFDYNAQINWLVAAQIQGGKHKTLKSFYAKYNERLREVVQKFCYYYRFHKRKEVYIYYDSTAKGINYIEKGHSAIDLIHEELSNQGWTFDDIFLGNPFNHKDKHLMINNAFKGQELLYPMFNRDNNVELLQAIPLTGTTISRDGFKKDKSKEKNPETKDNLPYELRTDGTDAWDVNFMGCLLKPYNNSYSFLTT